MKKLYIYPSINYVTGYSRGILQDLQKQCYFFIPNTLSRIIENINGKNIDDYIKKYSIPESEIINEYLYFLLENKLAYFSQQHIPYKKHSVSFDFPAQISNAIIVLQTLNIKELFDIIKQLENVGCEFIQLYCKEPITQKDMILILGAFDDTRISYIELAIEYISYYKDINEMRRLYEKYHRLFKICFYNSPVSDRKYVDTLNIKSVLYNKNNINYIDCGSIHPLSFHNNMLFFTESQTYNTCLNRKLCIDEQGNIKNCPAMRQNFGNIKNTTLQQAINTSGFKDMWYINKDKIDVCKDCEYRHMCTDCRCFIKDPENIYSQPTKCGYNPYICKWNGQEGYVPVEECGTYTKETGFVPDEEKISKLNKQIWGEDE